MSAEYLISRAWPIPRDAGALWQGEAWFFNLWRRQQWPWKTLLKGDVIHVFDRTTDHLVWTTTVSSLMKREYASKNEAGDFLDASFPSAVDRTQSSFVKASSSGYLLAFVLDPKTKLMRPRPPGLRLPRLGWIRDPAEINRWLHR